MNRKEINDEFWILAGILLIISFFLIKDLLFGSIISFWDWGGFGHLSFSELFKNLHTWQPAYLGYPSPQMLSLVLVYLLVIFMGGIIWSNIILCLSIPLSMFCMYLLASRFFKDPRAAFLSAIIYTINPMVLDRFLQAHIGVLLAYSLLPLIIFLAWDLYSSDSISKGIRSVVIIGLLVATSVGFSPHYLYIIVFLLLIIVLFRALQDRSINVLIKNILATVCVFAITATLLISWIIYILGFQGYESAPSLVDVQFLNVLSGSNPIYNVIRLVEHPGPGFLVQLGYYSITPWTLLGFIVPAFAFACIIFHKKECKHFVILLLCLCSLGIILSTGTTYFSGLYTFLYTQIPFFYAFRESSKFMVYVCLSYALMAGVTAEYLLSNSSTLLKKFAGISFKNSRLIGSIIIFVVLILHLSSSIPMLTGDLSVSAVHPEYELPEEYVNLGNWLDQQNGSFRVVILPYDNYVFHTWHLVTSTPHANIDYISLSLMPHESYQFSLYLLNRIIYPPSNEEDLYTLLNRANVKYIIVKDEVFSEKYPEAYSNNYYKVNSSELNKRLSNTLPVAERFEGYTAYENPSYTETYAGIPLLAIENRSLLAQPVTANRSILYLAQQEDPRTVLNYSDQIIMNSMSELKLILTEEQFKVNAYEFAQPARDISSVEKTMQSDWVRSDTYEFEHPFLFGNGSMTYGPGYAITNGSTPLNLPFSANTTARYEIWARGYSKSSFSLSINNQSVGNFTETGSDFEYQKIGEIQISEGEHLVNITPDGLVAIDQVTIVPVDEMQNLDQEIKKIMAEKTIIDIRNENLTVFKPTSEMKEYSPTHYEVDYTNDTPFVISMKQSYHPLWQACIDNYSIDPIIVDSYATGFYVTDGSHARIDFTPQQTMNALPSIQTFILKTVYGE